MPAKYSSPRCQLINTWRRDVVFAVTSQLWPEIIDTNQQYIGVLLGATSNQRGTTLAGQTQHQVDDRDEPFRCPTREHFWH